MGPQIRPENAAPLTHVIGEEVSALAMLMPSANGRMHSWTVAPRVTFTDVEGLSKNVFRITGGSDFKTWKGGENVK